MEKQTRKNILLSIIYFSLSILITWWFILQGAWLYKSENIMQLSNAIAGVVWAIQIAAALIFLRDNKWEFLRRIAFICLIGSCVLLPYCFTMLQPYMGMVSGFMYSLVIAVLIMAIMYPIAIRNTGLSMKWFASWLACLAIAITLQLTVVFKVL